jgi:hypothetical protein
MSLAQQYGAIFQSLRVDQKWKARLALGQLIRQRGYEGPPYLIRQRAVSLLRTQSPLATAAEIDALSFYMLARLAWLMSDVSLPTTGKKTVTYEEASAQRQMLAGKAESIDEMSQMDMLQLQQAMDQKGQLETLISNVMKAGYEGGQAAIQALKAS